MKNDQIKFQTPASRICNLCNDKINVEFMLIDEAAMSGFILPCIFQTPLSPIANPFPQKKLLL